MGDDQDNGGYLNSFLAWKSLVFEKLLEIFPQKFDPAKVKADKLYEAPKPIYDLKISNEIVDQSVTTKPANETFIKTQMLGYLRNNPSMMLGQFDVRVANLKKKNRETAEDHWQNVMNLDFEYDFPETKKLYEPGDIACIYPQNDPIEVSKLLKYFELEPATMLEVSLNPENQFLKNSKSVPDGPISAWDLFTHVLDINKPPKFFFFKILSFFCETEGDSVEADAHKERLLEMSFDEYYTYCVKERRTLSEILFDFYSVKLPLTIFIQFIGFLKVREYSIASSNLVNLNKFTLLVGSVEYETVFKRQIKGVCSQFFENLQVGDSLIFYIKQGLLRLPENPDVPMILIGPGTGIAPFISFIEERIFLGGDENSAVKNFVFFGNRNREKDFLCRDF